MKTEVRNKTVYTISEREINTLILKYIQEQTNTPVPKGELWVYQSDRTKDWVITVGAF